MKVPEVEGEEAEAEVEEAEAEEEPMHRDSLATMDDHDAPSGRGRALDDLVLPPTKKTLPHEPPLPPKTSPKTPRV